MPQIQWIIPICIILRVFLGLLPSYEIDMAMFMAFSKHLASRGAAGFYQDLHVVYAPAYMFVFWLAGLAWKWFALSDGTLIVLIKAFGVAFDFMGATLIWKLACRHQKRDAGLWLALIYFFNPALVLNTSIWGQFDTAYVSVLLAVVYLLDAKKLAFSSIAYLLACLIKPQAIFLSPLLGLMWFKSFDWSALLWSVLGGFFLYICVTYPFADGRGVFWVFDHYQLMGRDYPYATANGFNLWSVLGGQIRNDELPMLGLSSIHWSFLALGSCGAWILFHLWKGGTLRKTAVFSGRGIFATAEFFLLACFTLGTRMHERYALPVLAFMTASLIWNSKRWWMLALMSLLVFINIGKVYWLSFSKNYWIEPSDPVAWVCGALTVILLGIGFRELRSG